MKSRDALIRLKRFEVEEKRRTVSDIEAMIAEFRQMAADLDRQIAVEQERAGVTDINHYAYPTFARAAVDRRDNLFDSVRELESKLQGARELLAEAEEDLRRISLLEERDASRGKGADAGAHQAALTAQTHQRVAS